MGVGTLAVIGWADPRHGTDLARTMGLTTFALANLFFSFTVRSDVRSVFSLHTFDDRRFLTTSGMSLAAIILATELGLLQRMLHTSHLNLVQWLLCTAVATAVVWVSELRKAVLRKRAPREPAAVASSRRGGTRGGSTPYSQTP
jgi:P-type Ca2+ transporter type 2C